MRVEAQPAAWRDLPPVQRTVGAPHLTAPSAQFARDLTGRRMPDPMLAPLAHDVTADGPAGLVSGIAVPLVQRAPSGSDARATPAMPAPAASGRGRPTAQRALTSVANPWPRDAADVAGGATEGVAAGVTVDVAPLEGTAADAVAGPESGEQAREARAPALRALPVARLATATPGIAATRVADATAPAPVQAHARVVTPAMPPDRGAGASLSPPAATIVADSANEAELAPASLPDATSVAAPPLGRADDPARPVVARRTLGESRRLGLGAPLVGPPPSTARETGRPDLPVARRARAADATLPTPAHLPAAPAIEPAAAAPAPLPRLVVARRPATAPATATASALGGQPAPGSPEPPSPRPTPDVTQADVPAESSPDVAAGETAGDAASTTRPLVGESPISVARLARDEAGTDADVGTDADAGTAGEPGMRALRLAGISSAIPAAGRPAATPEPGKPRAVASEGPRTANVSGVASGAAVQRTSAGPGGDPPSGPARPATALPTARAAAPLVAARSMRSSPTASIATLGHPAADEPSPVIAHLTVPPSGVSVDAAGQRPAITALGRPVARTAPGVAVQREERLVVALATPGGGRGATPAAPSALPLMRSAVGAVAPDAVPAGRSGGAISWTPGAGFTTVAPTPHPFVQRAVVIDELASSEVPPAGGTETGAVAGQAGAAGASAAGSGGAGTDYEELAEHVYDRIRARISSELLLDRERAGTLVDG